MLQVVLQFKKALEWNFWRRTSQVEL